MRRSEVTSVCVSVSVKCASVEIYDHCVWEAAEWGIMKIDQGAISFSGHHWKHGLWPPPFSYH